MNGGRVAMNTVLPCWCALSPDLARHHDRLGNGAAGRSAIDPDLRAFHARGGKLLMYAGWADPILPGHRSPPIKPADADPPSLAEACGMGAGYLSGGRGSSPARSITVFYQLSRGTMGCSGEPPSGRWHRNWRLPPMQEPRRGMAVRIWSGRSS